jgi:hypothetical protein
MTTVTIDLTQEAMLEPEMLLACLQQVNRTDYHTVDIFCNPRKKDEWLEWGLRVKYNGGGGIFIGAIQRNKGAVYEFHS